MITALLTGILVIVGMLVTRLLSWETTRGLITDYVGKVTAARFKFDPRYNEGQTLILELDLATNNPDNPTWTETYPCGSGWTTDDNGKTASRKDGGDKFNRQSWYGLFIETVKKQDEALKVLAKRGDPTKAEIWVGTVWHFDEVTVDYGGEIGEKSRNMPVEFKGTGDVEQAAKTTPAATDDGQPDELMKQLAEVAKNSPDHGTFVREALKVDGVHSVIDQVAAEGDDGLYARLRS